MNFYVELYQSRGVAAKLTGRSQQWRWRAKSVNGRKLAQGEAYTNQADAMSTVHLLFGPDVEVREAG